MFTPSATSMGDMPPQRRRLVSLRNLRVQMALGSALVALVAVLTVAAIALAAVAVAFDTYQRAQLAAEASRIATTLGQGRILAAFESGSSESFAGPSAGPFGARKPGVSNVWIMNASGRLLIAPQTDSAQDEAPVTAALHRALGGQPNEGTLPGSAFPWLTVRLFAAAPIRLGGTSDGPVAGAVALSVPLRANRAAVFAAAVTRVILLLALGVAALAAVVATFFSRRVTRPLARLTAATAGMAAGDYGTRVDIQSPEEIRSLAESFNEMAAALERDVAELHHQEQLRRELVANVSHELATPLTAIQGFTEALLDDVVRDPIEREETTHLIAREAARLRRLVDQLRQVALFEAGAQALDRTALALPTLVGETLDVLTPEIERKHIILINDLPSDLPPVLADGDRLTEILLNLLDNALRHTPDGGRVEVSGAVERSFVRMSVADTGPGIAPNDRQRIFERFYRVDASRSSDTGGSGLGLAIVRALVEAHGGSIRADERPGGGARLSFTLPVAT